MSVIAAPALPNAAFPLALSGEERTFCFYRGRVAEYALLRAAGVSANDEVLIQAFTCLAVPAPIVGMGAIPVYVDIDPATFNMNPELIEKRITGRTRAIIVQHTFGNPIDMDPVVDIARRRNLTLIEDCCHIRGSVYRGRMLGLIGDAAFHSYEWGKPLIIGVGGTAVVNSPELLQAMRKLYGNFSAPPLADTARVHLQYLIHSLVHRPALFWFVRDMYRLLSKRGLAVGTFRFGEAEGRLNPEYSRKMAPSLQRRLRAKQPRAAREVEHRRRIARLYSDGLDAMGLRCISSPAGADAVFMRYPVLARDKEHVLRAARQRRIELGDWYTSPIHPLEETQWAAVGYRKGMCPAAEEASRRIVTLPIYAGVTESTASNCLSFLDEMRSAGAV